MILTYISLFRSLLVYVDFLEAAVRKGLVGYGINPFHTEASMVTEHSRKTIDFSVERVINSIFNPLCTVIAKASTCVQYVK